MKEMAILAIDIIPHHGLCSKWKEKLHMEWNIVELILITIIIFGTEI